MHKTVGPVYSYRYTPVVFDLDGDGAELLDLGSGIGFDWDGDGSPERCGWVSADDGLLAYDSDGDGEITVGEELSLKEYQPGAVTDLEGLRAFDSNGDNCFDVTDEAWDLFGIWQDADSDAKTDPGEFTGLEEAGVVSIQLTGTPCDHEFNGNQVYAVTTVEMADGSIIDVADVGLTGALYEEEAETVLEQMCEAETEVSTDFETDPAGQADSAAVSDQGEGTGQESPVDSEAAVESEDPAGDTPVSGDNLAEPEVVTADSTGVEADPATPPVDDAMLDHLYQQLVSDLAALPEEIPETASIQVDDVSSPIEWVEPDSAVDQDQLAMI